MWQVFFSLLVFETFNFSRNMKNNSIEDALMYHILRYFQKCWKFENLDTYWSRCVTKRKNWKPQNLSIQLYKKKYITNRFKRAEKTSDWHQSRSYLRFRDATSIYRRILMYDVLKFKAEDGDQVVRIKVASHTYTNGISSGRIPSRYPLGFPVLNPHPNT